jgi:glutamine amidotransferase
MKTALIKYNAGNVRSVMISLEKLGAKVILTDKPEEILSADKVIFPGVGHAESAMNYLKDKQLDKVILSVKSPFLGICLGMQLLCKFSEEGNTDCLGIFDVIVRKFPPATLEKVPHMGWNKLTPVNSGRENILLKSMPQDEFFYFVHGYYAEQNPYSTADCRYILPFSAMLQKDNFFAAQFHPEKSGKAGEMLLTNFLSL